MRYYHTDGLKWTNIIIFLQGYGATRTSNTLIMGVRIGANASKIVWHYLLKMTIHIPHDPAIWLLGIYCTKCMWVFNKSCV